MDTSTSTPTTSIGPVPELPGLAIVETLHVGARSATYLARQERLRRDVVVKVVHAHEESSAAWAAFRREARVASLSIHPAIAAVYTAGRTADALPFLVMELLPNGSLEDRLASGKRMPPELVRDVGIAISGALIAAHREGIVHGAVDASQVLFDASGSPKLTGFGLSRLGSDASASPDASADVAALATTLLGALRGGARSPRPPSALGTRLTHLLHECTDPHAARFSDMEALHAELLALRAPPPAEDATVASSSPAFVRVLKDASDRRVPPEEVSSSRGGRRRGVLLALAALAATVAAGLSSYAVVRNVVDDPQARGESDAVSTTVRPAPTSGEVDEVDTAPASGDAATTAAPATSSATASSTSIVPAAPSSTTVPAAPSAGSAEAPDAFVRRYYDLVNEEEYSQGWQLLSSEFRAARTQSFERYVRYWERYDVDVRRVDVLSFSGGVARVRVAMDYVTGEQRIAETDDLTVRLGSGNRWEIIEQVVAS